MWYRFPLKRMYIFFLRTYLFFLRMYVGFESLFRVRGMPQTTSLGFPKEYKVIIRAIEVLVTLGKSVHIFFWWKMYLFFLRMYVWFQSPFYGRGIPSQGSLKEYIGHNKGDWGLGFPWKKCTYFCEDYTYFS